MPIFNSAGLPIHFVDEGAGPAVVLLHGFAASAQSNWGNTGWIKYLAHDYRVVAPDCRGHGLSGKPHEREAYGPGEMENDVLRLLDHLRLNRVFLMGYSMGALTALRLVIDHEERFRAAVLGGIGGRRGEAVDSALRDRIVAALNAADEASVSGDVPKMFRRFAVANRNDLKALAACMAREHVGPGNHELATLRIPVMVVVGTRDRLAGEPERLTTSMPDSILVRLDGRDHLNAVGDRRFKEAVGRFFEAVSE